VFLQLVPTTPILCLRHGEIADIRWTPLSFFISKSNPPPITRIMYDLHNYRPALGHWFDVSPLNFPSLHLPVPCNIATYASTYYLSEPENTHREATPISPVVGSPELPDTATPAAVATAMITNANTNNNNNPNNNDKCQQQQREQQQQNRPPPLLRDTAKLLQSSSRITCLFEQGSEHTDCWPLWGMTLNFTMAFLKAGGQPQDWCNPPFWTSSWLANGLLYLNQYRLGAIVLTVAAVGAIAVWRLLPNTSIAIGDAIGVVDVQTQPVSRL
jgi:hypothetical protein